MPDKKRQHYVPRMILRNFSENGKTVGMYSFSSSVLKEKVGFKEQCYENYFYGKNGKLEDALSEIEGETAPLIKSLLDDSKKRITDEERYLLFRFLVFQDMRTKRALSDHEDVLDKMGKEILSKDLRAQGIDFDRFKITYSAGPAYLMKMAVESMHTIFDLEVRILDNETSVDFIVSDHPVVLLNQWAMFHPKFKDYETSFTGYLLKGLVFLLPLSPRRCLIVYDDNTYKCVKKGGFRQKVEAIADINVLNQLQSISSEDCIYFKDKYKLKGEFGKFLQARNRHYENSRPSLRKHEIKKEEDGRLSQLISNSKGDARLNKKLTFLKIIDREKFENYNLAMIPPRSWEAVREHERLRKMREE